MRTDLLKEASAGKINFSQTPEVALQVELKKEKERRWLEGISVAIDAYNNEITEHGPWSDVLEQF